MASSQQLRDSLLQTDEEFRRLSAQHRDLERRLNELSRQLHRNGTEEVEKATLKKHKLRLKDRMEEILRQQQRSPDLATLEPSVEGS